MLISLSLGFFVKLISDEFVSQQKQVGRALDLGFQSHCTLWKLVNGRGTDEGETREEGDHAMQKETQALRFVTCGLLSIVRSNSWGAIRAMTSRLID